MIRDRSFRKNGSGKMVQDKLKERTLQSFLLDSISSDLKHPVQRFFCFYSYMLRNMDFVFHILETVENGLEGDFFHIIAKSLL